MGCDDLFKKKRAARGRRRAGDIRTRTDSFLIVAEGTRTEPNYLRGLRDRIPESIRGRVDIDVKGCGMCTRSLVEEAQRLASQSSVEYQHIWVVFDRDDFRDFDAAIKLAKKNNFRVAWSNPCFEYWLYLHFHDCDSALHRAQYSSKLSVEFKRHGCPEGYKKNMPNLYGFVTTEGSEADAIARARHALASHAKGKPCSRMEPATTVHELVEELTEYLD